MPTAQLAEPPVQSPAAKSQAKIRKPQQASEKPPIDLAKETLSVPEAARLLDQEEWVLRMLCRKSDIPSREINGEFHIALPDFFAYRREQNELFERLENSPALKAMREISNELIDQGLYWKATPEVMAQSSE